jgi:hypothetical protein
MIFHAALPADHPESAALALARMLGGEAMPFPPGPGSWMAWSADGRTELELMPRGLQFVQGEQEVDLRPAANAARNSDWHVAIGTSVDGDQVLQIAAEAGWPARICHRADFFRVIEVWVDGVTMLEVLDPSMQAEYQRSMTPANWKRAFGLDAAA